jgi:hypothetical protein
MCVARLGDGAAADPVTGFIPSFAAMIRRPAAARVSFAPEAAGACSRTPESRTYAYGDANSSPGGMKVTKTLQEVPAGTVSVFETFLEKHGGFIGAH